MRQVTDVADKWNQEPLADQVITMGPELHLGLSVERCSQITNIQNFWLFWLMRPLDCGEWIVSSPNGKPRAICILCHIVNALRTGLLNCLNARSRGLIQSEVRFL